MRKIKCFSLMLIIILSFLSACAKKPIRSEFVKLNPSSNSSGCCVSKKLKGKGKQVVKVDKPAKIFAVAPRRVTPFVLRVWIAPWRDENDRLKWSRTVYVDLPINKWNLGVKPYFSDVEIQNLLSIQTMGEKIRSHFFRRRKK